MCENTCTESLDRCEKGGDGKTTPTPAFSILLIPNPPGLGQGGFTLTQGSSAFRDPLKASAVTALFLGYLLKQLPPVPSPSPGGPGLTHPHLAEAGLQPALCSHGNLKPPPPPASPPGSTSVLRPFPLTGRA